MKKNLINLVVVIMTVLLVACGNNNVVDTQKDEEISVKMIVPDGLPSIAISKVLADYKKINNMNIEYTIEKTPDLLLAELMKGEAQIAVIPSNLALQSYKKNLGYKVIGTIGWGSLYLVSTEDIDDISDVQGKEVYNVGKGLTPDIVFKQILNSNGIDESNVDFNYVSAASELAPMIMAGKAKYAVLPEPALSNVLAKNKDLKVILNLNEEWAKVNGVEKGYPQSTLMIKEDLYNNIKNKDAYKDLIKIFTESEEWVVNNPQDVSEKCEQIGIEVNKDTLENAIKNSNLKFTEVKDSLNEYRSYFKSIDTEYEGEDDKYDSLFIKE